MNVRLPARLEPSRAGPRRTLVLALTLVLGAGACAGASRPRAEGARAQAPGWAASGATSRVRDGAARAVEPESPGPAALPVAVHQPFRPEPVDIPDDSYAPEPVQAIGTIEIPKLGLVQTLFDGVTLHNIDRGPSHWPGTAMPGQLGNTVVAGHRVSETHPFLHIERLVPGDLVRFVVHGVPTTYRVDRTLVVRATDSWIADQTPGATGTLYACHPPGSTAERYVVRMALVP